MIMIIMLQKKKKDHNLKTQHHLIFDQNNKVDGEWLPKQFTKIVEKQFEKITPKPYMVLKKSNSKQRRKHVLSNYVTKTMSKIIDEPKSSQVINATSASQTDTNEQIDVTSHHDDCDDDHRESNETYRHRKQ